MKVIFHKDFYEVYTSDPAAAADRMEAIVGAIEPHADFEDAVMASEEDIAAVHAPEQIQSVRRRGLYDISALAAGGAVGAAEIGLKEPCFGLIRPPGHHASAASSWGFCYFNNMAVALDSLYRRKMIETAFVLDFDLHYGDGTVNILGNRKYVTIYNVNAYERKAYMDEVERELSRCRVDLIGISAGFDNHRADWGGLLSTDDYREMGHMAREAAAASGGGLFAILEGGYNHRVLGENVLALMEGMKGSKL